MTKILYIQKLPQNLLALSVILSLPVLLCATEKATSTQADEPTFVVVFDFVTLAGPGGKSEQNYGAKLADSVRIKLRKQGKSWKVIDKLTTTEASGPIGNDAKLSKVKLLLGQELGGQVALFGQVQNVDGAIRAEISCIDLRSDKKLSWVKVFSDETQRSRAVIAKQIVEAVVGQELWRPPEYGDEPEPTIKKLGRPLNRNGSFDSGSAGWDAADNVSTFFEPGSKDRGGILRVRTDLNRDPWLAYRKALRLGQADRKNPPKIATDTSYGCVGGMEGVHVRSEWLPAKPGQRYWLTADVFPVDAPSNSNGFAFPKVFVKGFRKTPHAMDGLPESSLAELGISPQKFASMDEAKRKKIIADDAKRHPMRYVRECYRWYLACRSKAGEWTHLAAPFPPRGGLPKNVEYLQIQIYTYWPPGTYLWDNVNLYRDPNQKKPLPEVKPRTKNFGRTSDVVEKESKSK